MGASISPATKLWTGAFAAGGRAETQAAVAGARQTFSATALDRHNSELIQRAANQATKTQSSESLAGETSAVLLQLLTRAASLIDTDREVAKAYIDRAVVLLEREASLQHQPGPHAALGNGRSTLALWQVNRVTDYLEKHLSGAIRICDLASVTRLTESYFSRAFKGSFGMAPQAYIVKRRMDIAQRLLLTSDESLCQIALACGLSDQAHLSKMFARAFGVPPGVWRRERRGCLARS